jgi:cysteine desulfuration protein SufE
MSIDQIQDEIVDEFATRNGDIEKILFHIASLGQTLPVMPIEYKTDKNLITGCHSKVWLAAVEKGDKVYFYGDSDTIISKGLVSLLLRVFNGQPPDQILMANLYFLKSNRLERFIGTKRSSGFAAMIDQIKFCLAKNITAKKSFPDSKFHSDRRLS